VPPHGTSRLAHSTNLTYDAGSRYAYIDAAIGAVSNCLHLVKAAPRSPGTQRRLMARTDPNGFCLQLVEAHYDVGHGMLLG